MTRPAGLDFGAIMLTGQASGVDTALLAHLLPHMEAALLTPDPAMEGDDGHDDA